MIYVIFALLVICVIVNFFVLYFFISNKRKNNNSYFDNWFKEFQKDYYEMNASFSEKMIININNISKDLLKDSSINREESIKLINSQLNIIRENIESKLENEFKKVRDSFKENNENLIKISNQFKESEKSINEVIAKNLDNINKKVEERLAEGFKETNKTFMNIIERLSKIDEAQKKIESLSTNIVSLQDILNDKKARGSFGEVQLAMILNASFGENNTKVFELQKKLSNDTIVDAYLYMPEPNGNIAIDSKFPLENYRLMKDDSLSEEKKNGYNKLFKQDIKKHIDDISNKYIIEGETGQQAIMFVPSEAVFAEINAYYDQLVEYASRKRVSITSPTTLMALLKVIMVVYKDNELSKNAKVLFKELDNLGKDFKLYSKRWESLQKDIDKVSQDVKDINTTTNKLSNKFSKIQNGNTTYLENDDS